MRKPYKKALHEDGKLRFYYGCMVDGSDHGEFVDYFANGLLARIGFNYKGKLHGLCMEYNDEGGLYRRSFLHYQILNDIGGSVRLQIPFLPKKPKRLPFKSGRNRFRTLEI